MKKYLSFPFIVFLFCCSSYMKAQCVFEVKYQSEAAVKLIEVPTAGAADIVVYKVSSESATGNNTGLWYFPAFPDSASKRIFFVSDTTDADMKVYFTSSPGDAGWVNSAKSFLLN